VRSEHRLPPFRELSLERLRVREEHLLDEIRLSPRPDRPSRRRTPRQIVLLAAAAVVAAAVVAAPTLALSSSIREFVGLDSTSTPTSVPPLHTLTDRLVYGMTKRQVLRRLGRPTKTVERGPAGTCWEYREHVEIGGLGILNAERVCFLGGTYVYRTSEIDGSWDYRDDSPLFRPWVSAR
jgi:hypothetical protein